MIDYKLYVNGGEMSVVSLAVSAPKAGEDASETIQNAIDECAKNGGGTVLLTSGEYTLKRPIKIRTSVILRGENDPTEFFAAGESECSFGICKSHCTILLAEYGENDPDGEPQIEMAACTGLKNTVVLYPHQNLISPIPYSPTIRQRGVDSITVENTVLVNPWRGIQCGPDANELHFIKNVYMTPLEIGMYMDMTTDIGRMQGMHVTPDCLAAFASVPTEEVRRYMLRHTTALFMARSDWEYGYDISAEYCKVGIKITAVKDSGPNAQLSGVKLKNCDIGVEVVDVNPYGIALSDSTIECDIDNLTAAVLTMDSFKTAVQLNGVDIKSGGGYKTLVSHNGRGLLSFADCTFTGWNKNSFAAECSNGGISFVQCDFSGDGSDILLDGGVSSAQILGCTFGGGEPDIENRSKISPEYTAETKNYPKASRGGFKKYPYRAEAAADNLILAEEFGAARNSDSDSTTAIQNALDEAKKRGGGIVYLAGGRYTVNGTLNVPTGVELRGIAEVPFHTMGGGSVLMTNHGRGDENAEPFVTLEERSGIRGIVFYNLEQDSAHPVEYPFAVQSRGKYCYVINAVFVNMWQALDMGSYPSEGHYISYISGAPFKCGAFLGSSEGEGWVENMQFNPHYWFRSDLPAHPDNNTWHSFWHNQMKYLDALKFGYNKEEHLLGTFVFAAKHGLTFEKQNGRGTSGKFIGHGTDSGLIALNLGGCEEVELINTQLVNIEADGRRSYIYSESNAGEYRLYNTLMWGDPHYAAIFEGGKVFVEQMNIVAPGKAAVTVNGGEIELCAVFFARSPVVCEINGGNATFYAPVTTGKNKESDMYQISHNGGECVLEFDVVKE